MLHSPVTEKEESFPNKFQLVLTTSKAQYNTYFKDSAYFKDIAIKIKPLH